MTWMKHCTAIAAGLALSWGAAAATIDVGGAKLVLPDRLRADSPAYAGIDQRG